MAQAIYGEVSKKYKISSFFSSAALGFCDGQQVSKNAVIVCNEIGIDISGHKPRYIKEFDLSFTDIFVVMTRSHAETLLSLKVPRNKIYILGGGIPDPFGSDLITYRRCRKYIEESVDEFCRLIVKKQKNGTLEISDNNEPYITNNGA